MSNPTSPFGSESDSWALLSDLLKRRLSRRQALQGGAFAAGAFSVSALLAACGLGGSTSTSTTKQGGTLRIVIGSELGTVDPLLLQTDQGINAGWEVLEGLTTIYHTGDPTQLQPLLAESWTGSSDAMTWTFKLRQGIKFHDGAPFNASAVKANADRWIDPSVTFSDYTGLKNLAGSTVVDDHTITFQLKSPSGVFADQLATFQCAILSPQSITSNGSTLQKVITMVGTGPYRFNEYVKGVHVLLTRDDSYRGAKPAWKQLEFKIVPDAATREAQLLSGDADVIFSPPPSDATSLGSKSGYVVHTAPGKRRISLQINTQDKAQPLLKDVRVRQALNYAIDKNTIVSKILFGLATVESSVMPPVVLACPALNYDYDPAKAKSLLAAAGASGMTVRMGAPTGRYIQDFPAALAIAGYFKDVGINVVGPTTQDFASYLAHYRVPLAQADWDLFIYGFSPDFPSGYQPVQTYKTGAGLTYYSNPQLDTLVTQGLNDPNATSANNTYCNAAKLIWDEAPNAWLWFEKGFAVSTDKVTGIVQLPSQMIVFRKTQPA